jgi:tetraacyldisaccharide 4'-kinase
VAPAISVGNLAMGGRGKTPVVAHIARWLVAQGERPAILSRGYGRRRREDGVVVVSDGVHILADVDRSGDEPLMLARSVPGAAVLVCEVRSVARALAERSLGATVHILDDGFQHRAVARDVDLVLIAAGDLRDRRAPFGRLREPVSALARASAVIVDGDPAEVTLPECRGPVFSLARSLGRPLPLEPHRPAPSDGDPVVALAGIATPARFSRALESTGWRVARLLAYRDHHRYSAGDLARLAAAVRETGAAGVLTTEKDAMRLLSCRPLPVPVAMVPLEVEIRPADRFSSWLRAQLAEARR